ncbi:anti-phage deoxyguanosine triphosphatase [Galenea microaerophila]
MENQERIWTQRYSEFLKGVPARPARIVYQRDRARVIHSASFRRLQSKTQIFGLLESDFYRTRLTHSMEVAQIGSGLVEQLITVGEGQEYLDWLPSFYLIEAICLAHDLGHPPFGHGGEVALNYMMRHFGGFEGNAQTLRILAKLGEYTPENGIDLSRRTTLGVMKYPALYQNIIAKNPRYLQQLSEPEVQDFRTLDMSRWIPPKGLYTEEKAVIDWVLSPFSKKDKQRFTELSCGQDGVFCVTQHKALDTTIMELADDIAYGIHDLEDAVAMKMVDKALWQEKVMNSEVFKTYPLWDEQMTERLFSQSSKGRKHAISKMVGIMVEAVQVVENEAFEHPLLRYQAQLPEAEQAVLNLLKQFVFDEVITIPEVKGMEYKGQLIVMELFKSLRANPKALLPRNTYRRYLHAESEQAQQRVICDYIAGMTNVYASKLYAKFFTPQQGSVFDRL